MTSKVSLLKSLQGRLKLFKIPELICINVNTLQSSKYEIVENLNDIFRSKLLAISSSAADEDGNINTSAGEYSSVLNIPSNNLNKIIGCFRNA